MLPEVKQAGSVDDEAVNVAVTADVIDTADVVDAVDFIDAANSEGVAAEEAVDTEVQRAVAVVGKVAGHTVVEGN